MGFLDMLKKPAGEKPEDQAEKPLILVVDDDNFFREYYRGILTKSGYAVETVTNGQEALTYLTQKQPNLILLDIIMPVMDGNELLRKLYDAETTKKIPVIMLTNAGNLDNMDKAKFYSAYKFLIKGNVTPEEIVEAIKEALIAGPKYIDSKPSEPSPQNK